MRRNKSPSRLLLTTKESRYSLMKFVGLYNDYIDDDDKSGAQVDSKVVNL
ncbi:unnamed protein product [Amoebophrya sp. A25]|nr:unnamed protein product [Amoebophrya sp. A25]|eukprot:GSA25T00007502001.1